MRDRVLGSYGILSGRLPAWRPGWLRLTQLHFRYNLMHCHLIVLEFVAPTGHNKKNTHKKNQVFRIFFFFQGVFLILSGPTIPATDAWMWVSLVGSLVFETVCVKSPTSMRLSVDAPQLLFCNWLLVFICLFAFS
jgi:hypothetical protein